LDVYVLFSEKFAEIFLLIVNLIVTNPMHVG